MASAQRIPVGSVFSGPRVSLRAPRLSDAERLVEIQLNSQEFLAPWLPTTAPEAFDVQATRKRILQNRREIVADQQYKFCFTLGKRGPVIGRVALSQVYRGIFQNAYLGYFIDSDYARQGLTAEAVGLILDVAFGPLGLHRLQAAIMPHNVASLALARKIGLRIEGRAVKYLHIAGAWQDHLLLAITADEWQNR